MVRQLQAQVQNYYSFLQSKLLGLLQDAIGWTIAWGSPKGQDVGEQVDERAGELVPNP